MQNKVNAFIDKHQILTKTSKVIVGLSGGADSVALLHFLKLSGYSCVAVHCNFHLRGEESDRDEQFVRDLCQCWDIPLQVFHFETEKVAKERRISIEMAARELRYDLFEEVRVSEVADVIAVAHHRDDNVETLLLNLLRGTGIRGLSGMSPVNGFVVRPFLSISRDDVEKYIRDNSLNFVTDCTNGETIYLRNKIRLELLPWMEEINPSVREAIGRTSENLRSVEHIYRSEIEMQRKRVVSVNNEIITIDIAKILAYSEPATLLFELLQPYGFNRNVCEEIFFSLNGLSGKRFFSSDCVLVKDRESLIVRRLFAIGEEGFSVFESDEVINVPISMTLNKIPKNDWVIDKNRHIAYFDLDKLKFPLTLRRWQLSDWFIPFGMNGRKKLSDYFSDHKFNLLEKEAAWILCSGDDIIWLVGERSDNRFRVDKETSTVLKIELK